MLVIPKYDVTTLIHAGEFSLVYRGQRHGDRTPVVLKTLRPGLLDPEQVARYHQEYHLTRTLGTLPGIIQAYDLLEVDHCPVIVLEDYGAQTLGSYSQSQGLLPVPEFLTIAITLADILARVHTAGVIHKDINPANILIHPQTREVKLIDFGIASELSRERAIARGQGVLEGTLLYLSPEQTGRMNRVVDYRSDFYALGATFFQLLTGQPPFTAEDSLELIHAHIARVPALVSEVRPEVPAAIAAVVQKLLAKNAEDRYQSAQGLAADLRACQTLAPGQTFTLGQRDYCDQLQLSQKLYGREEEVAQLWAAFQRVTEVRETACQGHQELVLVAGYSGIGKSALVQEVYKPVTGRRGYLVAGKFDRLQRNIPYRAFLVAFTDLISQLLTESDEQLEQWRDRLRHALGNTLPVAAVLLPQITLIVGPQPTPAGVSGPEAQNRINFVLQALTQVFAQPDHPLVIFLDDLQWADAASLDLLQRLLTTPSHYSLLLIGAYRDNEVGAAHPLTLVLEQLYEQGVALTPLALKPLGQEAIRHWLGDSLRCEPAATQSLAELVEGKTGGNPFFMGEFLKSLYRDRLIHFDPATGAWLWDTEAIREQNVTDNLVELMTTTLRTLPPATQRVLQYAACLGTPFDLAPLAQILNQPEQVTAEALWAAVTAELLIPVGDTYRLARLGGHHDRPLAYRFAHDRIQEAAYGLIPDQDRVTTHYAVGQQLLTRLLQVQSPAADRPSADRPAADLSVLFQVANQLNLGRSDALGDGDRILMAGLNLRAGRLAKAAAAYDNALSYLQTGLDLMAPLGWELFPDLVADLHQEAADVACLCGQYPLMTRLLAAALPQTTTVEQTTALHLIHLRALILQNQPRQAVDQAIQLCIPLGVRFPRRWHQLHLVAGLLLTQLRLTRWRREALMEQPLLTNPQQQSVMAILQEIGTSAYIAAPEVSPLISFKILAYSLRYGYSPPTPLAFAAYGLVLAGILGKIAQGYYYGQIAMAVADRLGIPQIRCRTLYLVTCLINHWQCPLRELLPAMDTVYQVSLEAGDLEYAAFALYTRLQFRQWLGDGLAELAQIAEELEEEIARLQQETALKWTKWLGAWVKTLRSPLPTETGMPPPPMQVVFSEAEVLRDQTGLFLVNLYQLLGFYFLGHWEMIPKVIAGGEAAQLSAGTPSLPPFVLVATLSRLRLMEQGLIQRKSALKKVKQGRQSFRLWATHCPSNYGAGQALIEGEYARFQGHWLTALKFFQQAITLAQTHQLTWQEAIAQERLGELYLHLDQSTAAAAHLSRAYLCYQLWGATTKAALLQRQYPLLVGRGEDGERDGRRTALPSSKGTSHNRTSGATLTGSLDLRTVLKASEAISGEIQLERLLTRLMDILIESAGAESGLLLLQQAETLEAVARGSIQGTQVLGQVAGVPWPSTLVNYVLRTQRSLVLDDAIADSRFAQDPYIQTQKPRSVLCAPLKNQGRLTGLIYLENNLAPQSFTPQRLEVVNLLSAQAAIALDNARLYTNLADLNTAYARFVPQQFLQHLNKRSILEVNLGDQVQVEMSVLFSDIRAFTSLSETLTPAETFQFINEYLAVMEPVIGSHGGFIDKYIGDAIMALFPQNPDQAVQGAIAMAQTLRTFNQQRQAKQQPAIAIGIGIHTGTLMLGTVGGSGRMDTTVISDAVNLTARLESLTKAYGVTLLISQSTYDRLRRPIPYAIRQVGTVTVRGKSQPVTIYEVFEADEPRVKAAKQANLIPFQQGVNYYEQSRWVEAIPYFQQCLQGEVMDTVAHYYLQACTPSGTTDPLALGGQLPTDTAIPHL